jgi:hypothetical protein
MMKVIRAFETPKRVDLDYEEMWEGEDQGLISSWERGREKASENPELRDRAKNGELIVLPWRGGVEKIIKTKNKYGSLRYLAMWQGIRGQDLEIDTTCEIQLVCSRTKVPVTFTYDSSKYSQEQE